MTWFDNFAANYVRASNKKRYPGTEEAEQERRRKHPEPEEAPDWIGNAPNYDKFPSMTPEEVLCWLNID